MLLAGAGLVRAGWAEAGAVATAALAVRALFDPVVEIVEGGAVADSQAL